MTENLPILARVRGTPEKLMTKNPERCWHCRRQQGLCAYAVCAVPVKHDDAGAAVWSYGECSACLGTGFLTWPAAEQSRIEAR